MSRALLFLLVLATPQDDPTLEEKREYVEKNVDKGIEAALRALKESQEPSGAFPSPSYRAFNGSTGLALYTLLALGIPIDDPAASKALDWLLNNFITATDGSWDTYEISLVAVALSYSVPQLPKGRRRERASSLMQRAADWLVAAQHPGGGWGYSQKNRDGQHDHSNSQFAVLGLRAAVNAGAKVRREVWDREVTHYKTSQQDDGGWGYITCYQKSGRGSTATMTAAGVMGLTLALGSTGSKTPENDKAVGRGLKAMEVFWKSGFTMNLKPLGGVPYLLYTVERACMLTGRKKLGDIDWYTEGAWELLRGQGESGWLGVGRNNGYDRTAANCFSLLFLKRAFVPVVTPSNAKPDAPTAKGAPPPDTSGDKPREME